MAPTSGIDRIGKCLAIFSCEKYKNDSENIPSTCSALSLLKKVLASFYGNRLKKKNKTKQNMLRSLEFAVSVVLGKIVTVIYYQFSWSERPSATF